MSDAQRPRSQEPTPGAESKDWFGELLVKYYSAAVWVRVLGSVIASAVVATILYPHHGTYYPEGNWLRGPLWLFKVQSRYDNVIGAVLTICLLALIMSILIQPRPWAVASSLIGIALWIAVGIWLARLAVA